MPDALRCTRTRPGLLAAALALTAASAFVPSGCGEPPPPPMTQESYEAAKAEQEKMIINEYGKEAFQRAYPKRAAELIKGAKKP
jgi:hypothetical protein